MAAQACKWRRSVGRRASPIRPTPAPMAPELTAVPIDNGSPGYLGWLSSATANP